MRGRKKFLLFTFISEHSLHVCIK